MNLSQLLARAAGAEARRLPGAEDLVSRRRLLLGGALAAAWASRSEAAPPPSHTRWLIDRITFGYTPEEQLLADTLGFHGYLEYHLNHQAIDDSALAARLQPYLLLNDTPYELYTTHASQVINQLIETTILRAVYTRRQLYERMVEFWSDHFNISIVKSFNPWLKMVDDREVPRPHALGNFKDMLLASAQSASMMYYLDNVTSVAGNPNENYARELMELHTMGVSGGYTQQDVVEVARCLTGWGAYEGPNYANWFTFYFDPARHDNGQKVVLGQTIPAGGGFNDGLMVIDILMAHPSTAQFVSRKLCRRFYGYNPPQSLINSVAATFTATNGDIKSMLRTLFNTIDPATAPLKFKRPFHHFVSALRGTKADIAGDPNAFGSDLRAQLAAAGHEPFHWGPPDGYPDSLEAWSGLLLPRWNFGSLMMSGSLPGVTVDLNAFLNGASTAAAIAARIDQVMFGGRMPAADRNRIVQYLQPDPPSNARIQEAVALAIASPGYQWY